MGIEIEAKSKITVEQAKAIFDANEFGNDWHREFGGAWTSLYKKDTYYSFNGIVPKKPKDIIRVREDVNIDADFEDIVTGNVDKFKFGSSVYNLTVKERNTDPLGFEKNKEIEGELKGCAIDALRSSMKITNFLLYFTKTKSAVSFHVSNKKNGYTLHCEIVNVNGIGPYLEVESTSIEDSDEALKTILNFFQSLGISDFDSRSWIDIINA